MEPFSIHLISNACMEVFENNTLTQFTNKLPITFNFKEEDQWEVGLEKLAFSTNFRNVQLPISRETPSIVVLRCHTELSDYALIEKPSSEEYENKQKPLWFDFEPSEVTYIQYKEQNTPFVNKPESTFNLCSMLQYYIEDKYYYEDDVIAMCSELSAKNAARLSVKYSKEKILSIGLNDRDFDWPKAWVFLHETFRNSFQFQPHLLKKLTMEATIQPSQPGIPKNHNVLPVTQTTIYHSGGRVLSSEVNLVLIGDHKYLERPVYHNGNKYYGYLLHNSDFGVYHNPLTSNLIDYNQKIIPEIVRINTNIIEQQIVEGGYRKDLIVFTPDFKGNKNFFFHDLEHVCYYPLLFNNIEAIKIKLLDQQGEPLQLLSGHATIIKLSFRQKPKMRDSFYARFSSKKTELYPLNKTCQFRVQLPATKELNSSWKVCLTSINAPNSFTTFLPGSDIKRISLYTKLDNNDTFHFLAETTIEYDLLQLVNEIDVLLRSTNVGRILLDENNRIKFLLNKENTKFLLGKDLAHVLGYETEVDMFPDYHILMPSSLSPKEILFSRPINMYYFRPNYYICYLNIIKSSILGAGFSKVLRFIPIQDSPLKYVITEFKRKEYYNIEHTNIDYVDIELRTHDGEFVNFVPGQEVLLNLEFTNETNPT